MAEVVDPATLRRGYPIRTKVDNPCWDHEKPIGVDPRKLFLKYREPDGGASCWLWTGAISPEGYGRMNHEYVHRLSWTLYNNQPIPEGYEIDHVCHNEAAVHGECINKSDSTLCLHRRCWNPHHLRAVPALVNKRSVQKSHCVRGHEFTEGSFFLHKNGSRQCRECHRIREAKRPPRTKKAR